MVAPGKFSVFKLIGPEVDVHPHRAKNYEGWRGSTAFLPAGGAGMIAHAGSIRFSHCRFGLDFQT